MKKNFFRYKNVTSFFSLDSGLSFHLSWIGIFLTVFTYYFIIWGSFTNFVLSIDHCEIIFCDFVRHYYPMGKEIFHTKLPSFMYYYSAFFAILLYGFGSFSIFKAALIWGAGQILFGALLFLIPVRSISKEIGNRYILIYLFIFLTSVPLLHNFKWGQVSVLITLCVIGSYYYYRKDRLWLSSILLAFAISIKYYPALFLLYFIVKKEFRYLGLTLISTLLFLVVFPSLLLGVSEFSQFQMAVSDALQNAAWISDDINSQYISHVISRNFNLKSDALVTLFEFVGYALLLVNIGLIYLISTKRFEIEPFFSLVILFLSTPFVLKTSWPHYFVYLPYCQIFLILILVKVKQSKNIHNVYFFAGWALILLSYGFSSVILLNIISEWSIFSSYGFLFISNSLLLLTVYLLTFHINQYSG